MAKLLFALIVCVFTVTFSEAKVFSRCELYEELKKQAFPENQIADWVCLIEHESRRDSTKLSRVNKDGSRDYGLFQINDRYWCNKTYPPGKDCNIVCADLLQDDITDAANCAKRIYRRHKFNAWYGWRNNCRKPGALPDFSKCLYMSV